MEKANDIIEEKVSSDKSCFVIMPISDPTGYTKGHFEHVFEDIVSPACKNAGFNPIIANQVKKTNLIHLDILQKLLNSPMAVCDLSSQIPNVLFELALRQAFDKPVALIQEVGTAQIFDISPFRYTEYRKERIYHEVLEDQRKIKETIQETFEAHNNGSDINSIVKLLALSKSAALPEIKATEASSEMQKLILSELSQLREDVRSLSSIKRDRTKEKQIHFNELERINNLLLEINLRLKKASSPDEVKLISNIYHECRNRLMKLITSPEKYDGKDTLSMHNLFNEIELLEFNINNKLNEYATKEKSSISSNW